MIGGIVSKNGRIVSEREARIPVDDLAFTYGYGVYENLKVRNGALFYADEHLARLRKSAACLGLAVPETIDAWLNAFVAAIEEQSFNVKILLVGDDCYVFATRPFFLPKKRYEEGVSVITFDGERPFPQAKTLSMLASYLAYAKAKEQGAYDALLAGKDGLIPEGTRTNLFYTDGKTVFTPPSEDVLEGVTRAHVIAAIQSAGIPFQERKLCRDELQEFSGFFLTSTSAGVLPISSIDGKQFPVPDVVSRVRQAYTVTYGLPRGTFAGNA